MDTQAVQDFRAVIAKEVDKQDSAAFSVVLTNQDPGQTWISLPQSGTLLVYYVWNNVPAQSIYIWHQGGSTTPIRPGENTIAVGASDLLMYSLANPSGDRIKIGYKYI